MPEPRDLILYVDDEEQALKYFRLAFGKTYEVLTATSAEEAIGIVEREGGRLALVISDQRMPGKSGTELLATVKERVPGAMRLLTTAFAELASAVDAVNKGWVYAYVHKPWQLDDLKVVIRRALEYYHLERDRDQLLSEKIAVMQELLLADRLRATGLILAAVGSRALATLPAWWAFRTARLGLGAPAGDPRDLWPGILASTRGLADLACALTARIAQVPRSPGQHDAAAAIVAGVSSAGGVAKVASSRVTACDPGLLASGADAATRLLRATIGGSVRLEPQEAEVYTVDLVASGKVAAATDLSSVDLLGMQAWSALALAGAQLSDATGADGVVRLRISLAEPSAPASDAVRAFIDTFDRSARTP